MTNDILKTTWRRTTQNMHWFLQTYVFYIETYLIVPMHSPFQSLLISVVYRYGYIQILTFAFF